MKLPRVAGKQCVLDCVGRQFATPESWNTGVPAAAATVAMIAAAGPTNARLGDQGLSLAGIELVKVKNARMAFFHKVRARVPQ